MAASIRKAALPRGRLAEGCDYLGWIRHTDLLQFRLYLMKTMDALSNQEVRERRLRLDSAARVSEATLTISKGEAIVAACIFTLILVLHWFYLNRFRWDSDEPQHLHVVWAWAKGLLPYRDVFDNHSPLFHWLCSPVFVWLGERPDIVIPMRWLMVPLFLISLWCVYMLGATVFWPRVGLWAAISTGLLPKYTLLASEFRTDNLWTTLWLVTLVVLLTG